MPTPEEFERQRELLQIHRETLGISLEQYARVGRAYATPELIGRIRDARREIARIKAFLRGQGQPVEDYPDDEGGGAGVTLTSAAGKPAVPPAAPESLPAAPRPPGTAPHPVPATPAPPAEGSPQPAPPPTPPPAPHGAARSIPERWERFLAQPWVKFTGSILALLLAVITCFGVLISSGADWPGFLDTFGFPGPRLAEPSAEAGATAGCPQQARVSITDCVMEEVYAWQIPPASDEVAQLGPTLAEQFDAQISGRTRDDRGLFMLVAFNYRLPAAGTATYAGFAYTFKGEQPHSLAAFDRVNVRIGFQSGADGCYFYLEDDSGQETGEIVQLGPGVTEDGVTYLSRSGDDLLQTVEFPLQAMFPTTRLDRIVTLGFGAGNGQRPAEGSCQLYELTLLQANS